MVEYIEDSWRAPIKYIIQLILRIFFIEVFFFYFSCFTFKWFLGSFGGLVGGFNSTACIKALFKCQLLVELMPCLVPEAYYISHLQYLAG